MNENYEKWKSFIDYTGHLSKNFGIYSRLYAMTTENLAGILNNIDIEPKSVLTVASSGDQVAESVLHGAEKVTCFDINPFSFYQAKLKLAAIKNLSYENFLNFFCVKKICNSNNRFLNDETLEKLASDLDDDTYEFFTYINDTFNHDSNEIQKNIYYNFSYNLNHMKTMCNYLKEDNYNKVKRKLYNTKVDYIETDFKKLDAEINEKYDLIMLSNINDSINNMYKKNSLKQYYNDVMKLVDNLNDNGIIQLAYLYTYLDYPMRHNDFYIRNKREEVFSHEIFDITEINAYDDNCMDTNYKDKIVTYQKKGR